jgi:hypothetical protein
VARTGTTTVRTRSLCAASCRGPIGESGGTRSRVGTTSASHPVMLARWTQGISVGQGLPVHR